MLPLVRRLAAHVGFDVFEFRDGKEALAQLQTGDEVGHGVFSTSRRRRQAGTRAREDRLRKRHLKSEAQRVPPGRDVGPGMD